MSPVVQALELGAATVCKGDWRGNITEELQAGQYEWRQCHTCSSKTITVEPHYNETQYN